MNLHPSVILNISEHHTRARANGQHEPIFGALLGKESTIVDSFELIQSTDHYHRKLELVKQIAQDLEVIGWYSTDTKESSIEGLGRVFLNFNPDQRDGYLPVRMFVRHGDKLVEVEWSIVTEDVEIIGLEHAKGGDARLLPQVTALKRLRARIKLISKFLKDIQSGVLESNKKTSDIINDIARLTNKPDKQQYSKMFNLQQNDVALQTYLGIMIKGCDVMNKSKLKIKKRPVM